MSAIPSNVSQLDPYLQRCCSENVTLKEEEIKYANAQLKNLLDQMVTSMKLIDETFKEVYIQQQFVGSYYENLRFGHPSEFDINLELQLPINASYIEIETQGTEPGYVKIRVNPQFYTHTSEAVRRKILSWLEGVYLRRDKINSWMQGIVDKAMKTVMWPQNVTVTPKTSGPALTLTYQEDGTDIFATDLVPVFLFETDKWPPQPTRQLSDLPWQMDKRLKWCVVPKCPRQDSLLDKYQWRMSFYIFEREIMKGQNHMKAVIKLMKLFRDTQNWENLSSYYVKTIFLWEQYQHVPDTALWRKGLGYLFMHMLGKLEGYLLCGNIPFFWDERCNLISHLNSDEIQNMCHRVKNLRRTLENALSKPDGNLSSAVDKLFTSPTKKKEGAFKPQDFGPSDESSSPEVLQLAKDESTTTIWAAVVGGVAVGLGALFLYNKWKRNDN